MEFIRFAILGLATGGIYAMISLGLVLVYRGSGLLNFAQGAMAMVGAYAYYEFTVKHGLPKAVSVAVRRNRTSPESPAPASASRKAKKSCAR